MAADWARKALKSPLGLRPKTMEAPRAATTRAAHSQRAGAKAGSISVPTRARANTDTTANSASAITWSGRRRRTARSRSSEGSGALSAAHAAPAARNIARPSRPVSSVKGVMSPSSGTPA